MKKLGIGLLVALALVVGIMIGGSHNQTPTTSPTSIILTAPPLSENSQDDTVKAARIITVAPTQAPTSTPTTEPIPTFRVTNPTPVPTPEYEPLTSGNTGDAVVALQKRLVDLGYAIGKVDGSYGTKTVSAIKAVQVLAGLEITGVADIQTQQLIWSEEAPTPQPRPTPTLKPTHEPTPEPELIDNGEDYILNKNTHVFHYPWCSSVDQMKESNKIYFTGTREEAIVKGYRPCKRCSP